MDSEAFFKSVREHQLDKLNEDVEDVKLRLNFLFENNFTVDENVLKPVLTTFSKAQEIGNIIDMAEVEVAKDREKLENNFKKKRHEFVAFLSEIGAQVSNLAETMPRCKSDGRLALRVGISRTDLMKVISRLVLNSCICS